MVYNPGQTTQAQSQAAAQDAFDVSAQKDWRVRIRLAQGANYLYKAGVQNSILNPLNDTDGVIFPYMPEISVTYAASYNSQDLTHSNYKVHQYSNSSVESVNITGDFTAQDASEAEYMLAVIHFFRSATKMFYGRDENPRNGTPPPLCFIDGLGAYQFNNHPVVITNFQYSLPNDVDYIRTTVSASTQSFEIITRKLSQSLSTSRLAAINAAPGGNILDSASLSSLPSSTALNQTQVTYVPSKIRIGINCLPIMSRNQISNNFSLAEYASGNLLLSGSQGAFGAMW